MLARSNGSKDLITDRREELLGILNKCRSDKSKPVREATGHALASVRALEIRNAISVCVQNENGKTATFSPKY